VTRKGVAALLYLVAAFCAVLDPTTIGLILAITCVSLLTVGYRFRVDFALVLSGWFLYFPLAGILSVLFGPFWSFLVSGTIIVVVTERLSLQNQLSFVLENPVAIDTEVKRLAEELSRVHVKRLIQVVALVTAIGFLAAAGALAFSAVSVLMLASVLILVAIGFYATRSTIRGPND